MSSAWVSPAGANRARAGRLPTCMPTAHGQVRQTHGAGDIPVTRLKRLPAAATAHAQVAAPAAHTRAGPPYTGAAHARAHHRACTCARPCGDGRCIGRRMHRPAHGQGLCSPSTRAWSQARASQPPPPPHLMIMGWTPCFRRMGI